MSLLDDIEGINRKSESRSRQINGVAVGVVTDNVDPENLKRVKVNFGWLSDKHETDWIRVATLIAGKGRGSVFTPEIGDEVLVAFGHGDINRPFVIGALWNKEGEPPAKEMSNKDKNDIKGIKTKSGHEIIISDKQDKERIELHTKSGHKIVLDDSKDSEKITISDFTGNNFMVFDSTENKISIESKDKLEIKSSVIDIEASDTMTLKSTRLLKIQGGIVNIN